MDQHIVYRSTSTRAARKVYGRLCARGLNPRMIDNPDPGPILRYASKGTYKVRIAVPVEEARRAVEIIQEWESRNAEGVSNAATAFRRNLVRAVVLAAVATLIVGLTCESGFGRDVGDVFSFVLPGMVLFTFGALILLAFIARARGRLESEGPTNGWRRWARVLLMLISFGASFEGSDSIRTHVRRRRRKGSRRRRR